jgi:phage-related minor tail protein
MCAHYLRSQRKRNLDQIDDVEELRRIIDEERKRADEERKRADEERKRADAEKRRADQSEEKYFTANLKLGQSELTKQIEFLANMSAHPSEQWEKCVDWKDFAKYPQDCSYESFFSEFMLAFPDVLKQSHLLRLESIRADWLQSADSLKNQSKSLISLVSGRSQNCILEY